MKRLLLILITLLLGAHLIIAQDNARSPEAGQAFNDGLNFAKKQKFESAIQKFSKAVEVDKNFPDAHYMRGYCYKKLNKFNDAEKEFRQAIKLDNKFSKAYIALGNLQSQSDRKAEAVNSFMAVLAYDDKDVKANYLLGKVYYQLQKENQAATYLNKTIEINPNYVPAYNILGLTLESQRKYAESAAAFKKAIAGEKKNSKKASYYYRYGKVLIQLKKYKEAESALLNALKFSRSKTIKDASNFYLGDAYKKMGQKQKAMKYYQRAAQSSQWKRSAEYEIEAIKNPEKYSY